MEPKIVAPGHGPISDRSALLADRDYLADMMKQVKTGMDAGKTADELAKQIDLSNHGLIAGDANANPSPSGNVQTFEQLIIKIPALS